MPPTAASLNRVQYKVDDKQITLPRVTTVKNSQLLMSDDSVSMDLDGDERDVYLKLTGTDKYAYPTSSHSLVLSLMF